MPGQPHRDMKLGCGACLCLGLGLCLLCEAGGSCASPAHTACSVLGPERGDGSGAALRGPGRGPILMAPQDSSRGPVIYGHSSLSLRLSFLDKRCKLQKIQVEVLGLHVPAPLLPAALRVLPCQQRPAGAWSSGGCHSFPSLFGAEFGTPDFVPAKHGFYH